MLFYHNSSHFILLQTSTNHISKQLAETQSISTTTRTGPQLSCFQKNFYCSLISNLNTICYQPFLSENILRQCQLLNLLALFYSEILQFLYNKQQPTLTSDFVLRSDSSSRNKQNQPSSPDFHFFHFGLIHHRILIQELIGLGLPSHHQQINKPGLNEQCRGSSAFSKLSFTRIVTTYSY